MNTVSVTVLDPKHVHVPPDRPGEPVRTISVTVAAEKAFQMRRAGLVPVDAGADEAYLDSLMVYGERDPNDIRRELPPRKLVEQERKAIKLGSMVPPNAPPDPRRPGDRGLTTPTASSPANPRPAPVDTRTQAQQTPVPPPSTPMTTPGPVKP